MGLRRSKGGEKGKSSLGIYWVRRFLRRIPFDNNPKYFLEDGTFLGRFKTKEDAMNFCKELKIKEEIHQRGI